MSSTRYSSEQDVKSSKNGPVMLGQTGEGNEAEGSAAQHHTWAHRRRPVRRSRLTVSILEKPKHGHQVRHY